MNECLVNLVNRRNVGHRLKMNFLPIVQNYDTELCNLRFIPLKFSSIKALADVWIYFRNMNNRNVIVSFVTYGKLDLSKKLFFKQFKHQQIAMNHKISLISNLKTA